MTNDVNENTNSNSENNNNVYNNDNINFDNHNNEVLEKDDLFSDTESIMSDYFDASEYDFNTNDIDNQSNVYIIPARRKHITEVEKLNTGNPVVNLSKTRSGKV